MSDKQSIRKTLLQKRDSIPKEVRAVKNRIITDRILSLEAFQTAKTVAFFASFRSEFDTSALITESIARSIRVALPKVDRDTHRLVLYEIKDPGELAPGYMGIPEPSLCTEERIIDIREVDALIIPGAGFDLAGNRLGYGAGYYDTLLSGASDQITVIAPAYEEQITDSIPAEPHDKRVSVIVTDRRVIYSVQTG